jgi:hypothetical protein
MMTASVSSSWSPLGSGCIEADQWRWRGRGNQVLNERRVLLALQRARGRRGQRTGDIIMDGGMDGWSVRVSKIDSRCGLI